VKLNVEKNKESCLMKHNISRYEKLFKSKVIQSVAFDTKGTTKKKTSSGPRIKFGAISRKCGSITQTAKHFKMRICGDKGIQTFKGNDIIE
jgi:hypothetical protein